MLKYRCKDCDAEFSEESTKDCFCCPACGSVKKPLDILQDILLPINWHELRCLTIWATNWIESGDGENLDETKIWLQKILNRFWRNKPKGGGALTIAQEIKEIQKTFPNVELIDEKGETIIPPKEEME